MAKSHEILGVDERAGEVEIRKAYHQLARRWHPDRFQAGPERLWAEEKMTAINVAFEEALELSAGRAPELDESTPEREQLQDARALMDAGQLSAARRALMRVTTRCAEWNYLFGAVLLRLGECEKAVLYFGIASRQRPDNRIYHSAYRSAEAIRDQRKTGSSPFKKMISQARRAFL